MTLSSAQTTNRQPAGGHLLPDPGVLEHVLDLCRAVEGQIRAALVQRAHDRQRVARAVEEVGVAERDVARAHGGEALDVAQDGLGLHDADAAVIDGGDRAVPAAMHAPVAGLHVADESLLPADRQAGVALEAGQQLARRRFEGAALEMDERPFAGPGAARRRPPARRPRPMSAGSYSPAITRASSSSSTSSRLTVA